MIDLKKLRELASATNQEEDWVNANDLTDLAWSADRNFIAECSPTVVIKLIDQLEAAQRDAAQNKIDAECFRWWVHEAAANPILVAKAIAHCITEDEYREVICGAMEKRDAAIKAAMTNT